MHNPDKVIEIGAWMLEHSHRALLAVSGGRFPKKVLGMQPVELHTTGRRSGQPRSTMLTSPICEPDRIVLVASKGGHRDHPDWYKNAIANPDVTLVVDGRSMPMHARTATAEERAELWPRVVKTYKGYAGYQRNTDREIPLLVCEPRP
ncbi:MAG TPA: nitroreductase/quinone reductase family protein [Mycobacterium sp.]|nr:nitroreductase/quinone reductase family protein [Mycobacterium sp.]